MGDAECQYAHEIRVQHTVPRLVVGTVPQSVPPPPLFPWDVGKNHHPLFFFLSYLFIYRTFRGVIANRDYCSLISYSVRAEEKGKDRERGTWFLA